jgi:alpha/beta superfamily hydrolase
VVPGKLSGKPGTTPAATKPPCRCGGLMIHGDADELVPEPAVRKQVDKLNTQKNVHVDCRVFAGADHIFAEHADAVSDAVEDHVGKVIPRRQMALAAG